MYNRYLIDRAQRPPAPTLGGTAPGAVPPGGPSIAAAPSGAFPPKPPGGGLLSGGLKGLLNGLLGSKLDLTDLLLILILLLLYLEKEDEEILIVLSALVVMGFQ